MVDMMKIVHSFVATNNIFVAFIKPVLSQTFYRYMKSVWWMFPYK
jgi:carotenoid cleavage dioxygenase-like enzyme